MSDANKQPYVEDAVDGDDTPIDGSKHQISSVSPSIKEEANVSRTRNKDRLRREESASPTRDLPHEDDVESDTAVRRSPIKRGPKRSTDAKDKDREKLRLKEKRKSATNEQSRPRAGRAATIPNLSIQTAAMSTSRRQAERAASPVSTAAATAPKSRPRAHTAQTAPQSVSMNYYGSPGPVSRPPPSNTRYYNGHPALGTSFSGPQSPYPPQSPMFLPHMAPPYAGHYPPSHVFPPTQGYPLPPMPDYFHHHQQHQGPHPRAQPLRHEYRRPRSAMGNHPFHPLERDYDDDPDEGGAPLMRAPSVKKRPSVHQKEQKKILMPPPPIRRSSTTANAHTPFAPPRPKRVSISPARSLDFANDTDSVDEESQYSPSEQSRFNDWRPLAVRRPNNIDPIAYEVESHYERGSPGRRKRRNSHYGGAARARSSERDYEEKFHSAQRYQDKCDGPTNPLTADTLRKIARTPSQRTKSTGSRGNDTYALTARNSMDTEDLRVLVTGPATFTIGDASVAVQDRAVFHFPTNVGGAGGGSSGDRASRGGSNDSDTTFDDRRLVEDRRTRVDRPQTRISGRASSRPASHARGLPAPGFYYHPPPATEYGSFGGQYEYMPQQQQPMYAPPSRYPHPGMR